MSGRGETDHQSVRSSLLLSDIQHHRFHPCRRPSRTWDLLQAPRGAVHSDFAFMRIPLHALALAAMLLLDAASVSAADCLCERLSAEGCSDSAQLREEPTGPPPWCERSDDPRCMPANTHGTSVHTLVPVAMSCAQPIRWDAPPRTGSRLEVRADGDPRTEYSRRVERPPR